jgi:hypothetical protein
MQIELLDAPPGVTLAAEKVEIPAGKDAVAVPVKFPKAMSKATTLKFRATGKTTGDVTVVSEAVVALKGE